MKSSIVAASDAGSQRELPPENCNFSIDDLAQWAGTSKPTIWREIKAGRLEVSYIGKRPKASPEQRAAWKATWKRSGAAA